MLIGYARVSTQEQQLDLQLDALKAIGCEKIFTDVASGSKTERPGFLEALTFARAGDTIIVWKLDRLGRSINHLIQTLNSFNEQKIGFKSLHENVDTTTSTGKLIFHIFSALAEFERDLIGERTKAGLLAARARGKKGGRPQIMDKRKITMAKALYLDKTNSIPKICNALSVSKATLYKYLKLDNTTLQVDST